MQIRFARFCVLEAKSPSWLGTETLCHRSIDRMSGESRGGGRGRAGRPASLGVPAARRPPLPLPCPGWPRGAEANRCVAAAEACAGDARCGRLRTEYVARCLGRPATRACARARCRHALRRFFARAPPALAHALLFCACHGPACAERRRQTFAPACAFAPPGRAPPSCLRTSDACERSPVCGPRLLAFQASCSPVSSNPDGCARDQAAPCQRAFAGLVGTAVTPNYVDNASARVAPWCDCRASGNRRDECEAFRGLFTRNPCLDGAIQAFDSEGFLGGPSEDLKHSLLQVSSASGDAQDGDCLLLLLLVLMVQAAQLKVLPC
ncbi:GDNF family receptor alpha-4 [Suncus etruscus]|uniref:GDNF family receptor alpha-4 n=1 Tax=Suncus etruscus TaxID=109475 RepID=UPI00210FD8E0|nr:GDNF family receptor alpha-4 [Suncus etruscus]